MDVKCRNREKFEIFSNFLAHPVESLWSILTVLHQNVRRSLPYTYWTTFGSAEKIEMVAVHYTNATPIFWVFNSPSTRPPGADEPQRGKEDVGRHCRYTYVSLCNERNTPVCCKFAQLHSHQILLKSVNIWLSYCEKQKGELFWNTVQ